MAEKNFQLLNEESRLEFFIHNYWLPEWHNFKINNYIYNLKNFDGFCKDVLQMELSEDIKDMMKDLSIVEIIASTMFLAETFAAIAEACSTNPKNIQKYLKEFAATNFYSKINSMDNEDCAKVLSIPQLYLIREDNRKEILEALKDLKEVLNEIREYYFYHLDLFNSYKHGFRIFSLQSFDEDDKPIGIILHFSRRHEQNEVTLINMDRNTHKHQKLARDISNLIRIMLENYKNKLENPDSWNVTIPAKMKEES